MLNTPQNTERTVLSNIDINTLYDDISKKYIPQGKPQATAFAKSVRAENDSKTVRNIWEYCRKNFTYKFDGYPDSKEIIRLPNASFEDKAIDCEDFAILIGSTLCNLGIPFMVRMAAYAHTKICHIYIVALIKGRKVIIDPCNPVFNKEDKGEYWDTFFDEKGNRIKSIHALGQSRSIGRIEDIKDYVRGNPNIMFGTVAPMEEPQKKDKDGFVKAMMQSLRDNKKENKVSSQNLAKTFGITVQMEVKELTELAIVYVARELAHQKGKTESEKYQDIVKLYQNQVRLNHRSSESIIFQQYSTPAPITYLMGLFCGVDKKGNYLEPSAGNGLMTIAGKEEDFTVNEISDLRKNNLRDTVPPYRNTYSFDGSDKYFPNTYGFERKMDAVLTNPPFGQLPSKVDFGKGESQIKINKLDHLMSLIALDCMKDDGKCAIILGGHTNFDSEGRIAARTSGGNQASGDRFFFNYLYHHYNVKDVIFIDGDLYARQGTSFDVRVVLIDGRKQIPSGFAPLKDNTNTDVVKSFDELYNRFERTMPVINANYPTFLKPIVKPIIPMDDKTIVQKHITKHKIGDTILDTKTNTQAVIKKISRPKEKTPSYGIESQLLDIVWENGKKAINMRGSQFVKVEEKPQVAYKGMTSQELKISEGMGIKTTVLGSKGAEDFTDGWVVELTDDISSEKLLDKAKQFPKLHKSKDSLDFYEFDKIYFDVSIRREYEAKKVISAKLYYHLFKVNKDSSITVLLSTDLNPFKLVIEKIKDIINQSSVNKNTTIQLNIVGAKGADIRMLEKGSVFEITKDDLLKYNQIKSKSPEEIYNYFYSFPFMLKTMPQNYDTNKYYVDVSIAKESYDYYRDRPANGFNNFFHLFTVTKEGTVNIILKQHHDGINEFMNKVTEYFNPKPTKTNDLELVKVKLKLLRLKLLLLNL